MIVEWTLQREASTRDWMFGTWDCAGVYSCLTLEDEQREWKVAGESAIPAGRYRVIKEFSPKFKKALLTLVGVPDFVAIRVHSVRDDDDTEGCIGVGDQADREKGMLSGGLARGVEAKLIALWDEEWERGNEVWLTIKNADEARYVDSGNKVDVA